MQCVDNFGQSVEQVLIKYGKNIVHEQYILNRLANAIMDIYGMTVAVSRASRALKENYPTAGLEKTLAQAFCYEVRFNFS